MVLFYFGKLCVSVIKPKRFEYFFLFFHICPSIRKLWCLYTFKFFYANSFCNLYFRSKSIQYTLDLSVSKLPAPSYTKYNECQTNIRTFKSWIDYFEVCQLRCCHLLEIIVVKRVWSLTNQNYYRVYNSRVNNSRPKEPCFKIKLINKNHKYNFFLNINKYYIYISLFRVCNKYFICF